MLTAALEYAAKGWHVFPVQPRGKQPLTRHGVKDATTDLAQIGQWWTTTSEANVGVGCGPSGLVVIDIDDVASVKLLPSLPRTLAARTGSGGYHVYYAAPSWSLGPTVGRLPGVGELPGVDLRAGASYVLAPPSVTDKGSYEWTDTYPLAPCPSWLKPAPPKPRPVGEVKEGTKYAKGALRSAVEMIRTAVEGTRNDSLNRAAFPLHRFIEQGELDVDEVVEALLAAAEEAGLPQREAERTLRSALGG